MPDDLGGQPFPNGEEPEYRHHGAADDEFASVVFDEDFVRAAAVHEPTAAERILAAAQSHAESETARGFEDGYGYGPGADSEFDLDAEDLDDVDEDDLDDPDNEGRFDRSDYSEYVELADGDEYGPYDSYGTYNAYGDAGQYDSPFRQYNQYENYSQFGIYRRYDPRLELGEEHGSDFGRRYGRHRKHSAASRKYRGHVRWQRPVAWVLAVMMGIGMVALALSAVYRGTSQQRQDPAPRPATSDVDTSVSKRDGARGAPRTPSVSAQPRAD